MLYTQKPSVLCLTETWASDRFLLTFVGYTPYWCNRNGRGGGLCMIVHSSLCFRRLNLLPHAMGVLEAQAISLTLLNATALSILNLYNPNGSVTHQVFTHYIQKLPSPHLVVGDFNAHSLILYTRTNNQMLMKTCC
jgi:hypothetical protein